MTAALAAASTQNAAYERCLRHSRNPMGARRRPRGVGLRNRDARNRRRLRSHLSGGRHRLDWFGGARHLVADEPRIERRSNGLPHTLNLSLAIYAARLWEHYPFRGLIG